jgi:uncharacterized protein (DUF1684 family)
MERLTKLMLISLFVLSLSGCQPKEAVITDPIAYKASIQVWKEQRIERLKSKTGWLNLAGLLWLEEGKNTFGSDSSNHVVFPEKAAPFCGTLVLENGEVTLKASESSGITHEGQPVTTLELKDDHADNRTNLEQGELAWYIVKRGERYGIRLRDYRHPNLDKLDSIPAYPVNTDYVVEAELHPFNEPRTMEVATPVAGFTEKYQCPGELHFSIRGKELILYPFKSGEGYFLVIADQTTGLDTYGAGRFMYSAPDSLGRIILDFNKAYNPPCAFTPYATCPMPPRENFLPVAIEAGEKDVHLY